MIWNLLGSEIISSSIIKREDENMSLRREAIKEG